MPSNGGNRRRSTNENLKLQGGILNPFPLRWYRGCYIHLGLLDGVDELYPAGQERDAPVGIGASGAVFEVSLDGAAHVCELAADLVVPARKELDFQEEIPVGGLDEAVVEAGLLAAAGHVGLVLGFVAHQEVGEGVLVLGRARTGERPVGLVDLALAQHLVQAFQGLGGLGKEADAAHGAVQAVGDTQEHLAGLGVPPGNEGLEGLREGLVAGLVSLHDLAGAFIENHEVVILVEDTAFEVLIFRVAYGPVAVHARKVK